jgi:serine protease AprX
MPLRKLLSLPVLALVAMILMAVIILTWGASPSRASDHQKISARVLAETANGGATEALVVLNAQANLAPAAKLSTKLAKGRFVVNALRDVAARTQTPIISLLNERGISYQSFWIVNMIQITGDRALLAELAARPDVRQIDANPRVRTALPHSADYDTALAKHIEWNVKKVKAPRVWTLGFKGQGMVVAGADTGVQWDHPALKAHYRGWNGAQANHDYNWHDATPEHSPVPVDPNSHGTFTVSEMVGDDGQGNQVGVAPGAQWIACRNMDQNGTGSPTSYSECFQFLIAPYPVAGGQGNPALAPDSINNSWVCPPSEGCSSNTLQQVVDSVRAAGIFPAMAAGNDGPSCSTIEYPPAIYASSVSVAALDSTNYVASFSSRGPVTVDGSNRIKPDVAAPGVSIRGAVPGNGYSSGWSGTSMAAPHVAGGVALIWQAKPSLAGNIDATEALLENTALHKKTAETCGGTQKKIPNNTYGYGLINLYKAVTAP